MKTLVWANAVGAACGVPEGAGEATAGGIVGRATGVLGAGVGWRSCSEGTLRRVFGGKVGSGSAVGIVRMAGPGITVLPGLTMCGVTTITSSSTPDAYKGDVRDPMTQQSYMWNRNNPYAYSDPSGYVSIQELEADFARFWKHVTHEGVNGRQSCGLSARNTEAAAKETKGELPGNGHTTKFREAAQGTMNRFNNAVEIGAKDLAAKIARSYNQAVNALKGQGVNGPELERR